MYYVVFVYYMIWFVYWNVLIFQRRTEYSVPISFITSPLATEPAPSPIMLIGYLLCPTLLCNPVNGVLWRITEIISKAIGPPSNILNLYIPLLISLFVHLHTECYQWNNINVIVILDLHWYIYRKVWKCFDQFYFQTINHNFGKISTIKIIQDINNRLVLW